MNLRQLINSNARVVTKNDKSYKNFTECKLGNIININTRSHVDHRYGLIHMVMYITSVTRLNSPITIYDKPDRRKREFTQERRQDVSTYTVAMSFSDYWELDITMNELLNLEDNSEEDLYHSKTFEKLNNDEMIKYRARLYKEARKKYGKQNVPQEVLDREALDIQRKRSVEERRSEVLDIRIAKYIEDWAKASKIRKWYSENESAQRQYICKQLYTHPYTYEINGNNIHIYTPLTIDNRVRVNCTCPQFYYTYAWYNADHKVLIGPKPPAYVKPIGSKLIKQRTADSTTVRNKNKLPGMCKHIQFMISYLVNLGILQPLNSTVTKNIYNSQSSLNKINDVLKSSEKDKSIENSKLMKKAEDEFSKYKKELNWAKRKNIEFGEGN